MYTPLIGAGQILHLIIAVFVKTREFFAGLF